MPRKDYKLEGIKVMPKQPKQPKQPKTPKAPKMSTGSTGTPKYKPLKLVNVYMKKNGTIVSPHFKGGNWS